MLFRSLWARMTEEPQRLDDMKLGQALRDFAHCRDQRKFYEKGEEELKAQLLAAAGNHKTTYVPGGVIRVQRSEIAAATITRKAHVRTVLKAEPIGEMPKPAADERNTILASG